MDQLLTSQKLDGLAWVRIRKAHVALLRRFDRALVEQHGLTAKDYEVLITLARAEDHAVRHGELAERVELSPSGVTRLLRRLERAGYTEKKNCDTDARVTYARLTDAGMRKLEEAAQTHRAVINTIFEELYSERELERLNELLSRLPGAATADADECTAGAEAAAAADARPSG